MLAGPPEEPTSQIHDSTNRKAGFTHVAVVARHPLPLKELEEMACCPGSQFIPALAKEDIASVEGKVVSIKFRASKPGVS